MSNRRSGLRGTCLCASVALIGVPTIAAAATIPHVTSVASIPTVTVPAGTLQAFDPLPPRVTPTPDIDVIPGTTPGGGYLALSLFGIAPLTMGDETLASFTTPSFVYAGEVWNSLRLSANGYVVVGNGTGTSADQTFINQSLPNPTAPNNVLAPFWTDLNPGAAGGVRIGTLTDGVLSWIVADWDGVREFSAPVTNSFQVWIGINGVEDISFGYGTINGMGDLGFLTVGAEDASGTVGENRYFDGAGVRPITNSQLRVFTAGLPIPEPGMATLAGLALVGTLWRRQTH
jgi:hypothetical protein